MKPVQVYGGACLLILILVVMGCGCTSGTPQGNTGTTLPLSPTVPVATGTASCGITTCHGLNLACGPNPPQVCTMEYALGDKCRRFAYCDGSGGSCRLVTSQQYDTCRACVQRCGGADPAEIFTCEEKC